MIASHILVTAPFCCGRRSRKASAPTLILWQQAKIEITLMLIVRATLTRMLVLEHFVLE